MSKVYIFLLLSSAVCTNTTFSMEPSDVPSKKGIVGTLRNIARRASFYKNKSTSHIHTITLPCIEMPLTRKDLDAWLLTARTLIDLYEDSGALDKTMRTKAIEYLILGLENKERDRLLADNSMWTTEDENTLQQLYTYYGVWNLDPVRHETIKSLVERDRNIDIIEAEKMQDTLHDS